MPLPILYLNPSAPASLKAGTVTADSLEITWDLVPGAKSYIIHYIDKATSNAKELVNMGYVEGNTWTLDETKNNGEMTGKTFTLSVQAYNEVGVGADEVEKARYLHDGQFVGSEWSRPFVTIEVK